MQSHALISDARVTPWADAEKRLIEPEKYRTYWLSTVRADVRPHTMPLLGVWLDGAFYFVTGESTRKGRNLAENPRCTLSLSSTALPSLDLIIEGEARKVTGDAELRRVAGGYESALGWRLEVRDGGLVGDNAPTAGPPPYTVFELTLATVYGLPGVTGMANEGYDELEPFAPTRWRF